VPSCSTGFWVATTQKGWERWRVTPSTVTEFSSIASKRALWVLGLARLISSASTTLAKTGPAQNSKSPSPWL
jgi:hypothetical protein